MSVEVTFKETAIYIFFILVNIGLPGSPAEMACNFTLDGQPAGSFTHIPAPTNEFLYNSLVFSQRNLPNVDHKLSISTLGLDCRVWVNFDYAIYTADDALPPLSLLSSSSLSPSSILPWSPTLRVLSTPSVPPTSSERVDPLQIGAIAGGIVGAFFGLFALLLLFVLCHRRKRLTEREDDEFPTVVPLIPDGCYYNDFNARFITPFANPYMDRPESEFIQNRTSIYSPVTQSGASWSTVGPSMVPSSTYPSGTIHQPMDPNIISTSPSGHAMSTDAGTASATNSIPPMPLKTGVHSPQDYPGEVMQKGRQAQLHRQMRALKQDMRDLTTDFHVVTTRRRVMVASGARSEEIEMSKMREQIRMLKEIEYVQAQQQSMGARIVG